MEFERTYIYLHIYIFFDWIQPEKYWDFLKSPSTKKHSFLPMRGQIYIYSADTVTLYHTDGSHLQWTDVSQEFKIHKQRYGVGESGELFSVDVSRESCASRLIWKLITPIGQGRNDMNMLLFAFLWKVRHLGRIDAVCFWWFWTRNDSMAWLGALGNGRRRTSRGGGN